MAPLCELANETNGRQMLKWFETKALNDEIDIANIVIMRGRWCCGSLKQMRPWYLIKMVRENFSFEIANWKLVASFVCCNFALTTKWCIMYSHGLSMRLLMLALIIKRIKSPRQSFASMAALLFNIYSGLGWLHNSCLYIINNNILYITHLNRIYRVMFTISV